jgi:hypothetical protein
MIKSNNFKSIRRLLTFIFLFSGIMACALSPCRVFASGSTSPAINATEDQIATFDEDAATTLNSESTANVSSLLHAENYQASVYFPDRLSRIVTSYPWMHIIPFAALVILALATTRFFGRRRQKTILAENRTAFENITAIGIGAFLIISITAGISYAQRSGFPGQDGFQGRGGFGGGSQISISTKDGVASLLGEGETYQKDIALTTDLKKVLKEKLSWEPQDTSIKVYYSKTKAGAIEAYAFVLSDILARCGGTHKYCIKVSSKGQVEGVKILELNCHHSFGLNNEVYLNQFKTMNTENADTAQIDALTRVTLSSQLTHNVVRRALILFEYMNKVKANA